MSIDKIRHKVGDKFRSIKEAATAHQIIVSGNVSQNIYISIIYVSDDRGPEYEFSEGIEYEKALRMKKKALESGDLTSVGDAFNTKAKEYMELMVYF